MVPASELAAIQAAANATLDQSASIYRKTPTPDGYGTEEDAWDFIENVMCGIGQPTGGQLQNYDYLVGSLSAWQVRLPVGTDILEQDHLQLDSKTLVVQVVLAPRSYPALLVCLASEVQ